MAWAAVSIVQQKAEHSQKEQSKGVKKGMLLSQHKRVKQDSFCLKSKEPVSEPCLAFPLLSPLEASNPSGKSVLQALARRLTVTTEAART